MQPAFQSGAGKAREHAQMCFVSAVSGLHLQHSLQQRSAGLVAVFVSGLAVAGGIGGIPQGGQAAQHFQLALPLRVLATQLRGQGADQASARHGA